MAVESLVLTVLTKILDFPGQSFFQGHVLDLTLSWFCPGFAIF